MKNLTKEKQKNEYEIWIKNTKERFWSEIEQKMKESIKRHLIEMGLLKEEKES